MTAIDTNSNVASHIDLLKGKGITHVGRYYASNQQKRLTPQEARAISEAGMQIFVVFENAGSPSLTFDQGVHDAQLARQQAKAVGQPEGSAIYFALEGLPHGYAASDVPGAKAYMSGVASVLGDEYRRGVYGDGVICKALLDAGLVAYTWLSASSSFPGTKDFAASNLWSIKQDSHVDQVWDTLSVDTNLIKADIGAFRIASADVAAGVPGDAMGAVPMAAMAFLGGPTGAPKTYTVKTNHRYRATVTLGFFESLASNDQVAQAFAGYGFTSVVATGDGTTRTVEGNWLGPDTTAPIDHHITEIVDLGLIAPGS